MTKLRYEMTHCPMTSLVFGSWPKLYVEKKEKTSATGGWSGEGGLGGGVVQEETNQGGSRDRCSPQGEPPLTHLPHKLFCSFRLHSKVVELGYKIISQATCLSSLAVQLANWREWFPVWATIQNMAVKIWMISSLSFPLSLSCFKYSEYFSLSIGRLIVGNAMIDSLSNIHE